MPGLLRDKTVCNSAKFHYRFELDKIPAIHALPKHTQQVYLHIIRIIEVHF